MFGIGGKKSNQCVACGQWSGNGHKCPTPGVMMTGERVEIPRRAHSAFLAGMRAGSLAARIGRAEQHLAAPAPAPDPNDPFAEVYQFSSPPPAPPVTSTPDPFAEVYQFSSPPPAPPVASTPDPRFRFSDDPLATGTSVDPNPDFDPLRDGYPTPPPAPKAAEPVHRKAMEPMELISKVDREGNDRHRRLAGDDMVVWFTDGSHTTGASLHVGRAGFNGKYAPGQSVLLQSNNGLPPRWFPLSDVHDFGWRSH